MKIKELALCLLALPLVWACSSDNDNEEIVPEPKPAPKFLPLTIEVSENPLVNPSDASSNTGKFKAPITFLNTLEGFNLSYIYETGEDPQEGTPYMYGTEWVSDNDGKGHWTCGNTGQYGWPSYAVSTTDGGSGDGDIDVTWYAYTDGTNIQMNIVEGNKNPYLNFTVEESSTNQKDLLVSKNIYTWNRTKGVMHFTFDHACSALKFYIKKATNVEDKQIVVSEVKLCNVKSSGRYYLDKQYGASDCWELQNVTSDYTLFAETDPTKAITLDKTQYQLLYAGTLSQDKENAYLFMIPQTLTACNSSNLSSGAYIYLKLKYEGNDYEGYVPFAGTFEMGKKHEVYINIGKNSLYNYNLIGNKIIN